MKITLELTDPEATALSLAIATGMLALFAKYPPGTDLDPTTRQLMLNAATAGRRLIKLFEAAGMPPEVDVPPVGEQH